MNSTDSAELARVEERLNKQRALELFERAVLFSLEPGTTATHKKVHQHLF